MNHQSGSVSSPVKLGFGPPLSGVTRVLLLRKCRLEHGGHEDPGVVCNLSTRGAYVASEVHFKVGDRMRIAFELPRQDRDLDLPVVVRWVNDDEKASGLPPGCGVQFVALPRADQGAIEATVRDFDAWGPRPKPAPSWRAGEAAGPQGWPR